MLLAVIQHGVIVSRNRHNHFVDRIDRQRTVVNNKRHFLEVIVVVRELVSFQTHLVGARVSALHDRAAAEREVAFFVQLVVDRHVVARNRMLLAVIQHGVIMSRDRHNHFGKRVDLEPAVRYIERHVLEVAVRVCELVSVQTHRVGARVGSRRFRGAVVREVSRRVTYTLGGRDRHVIALNRLFASVIRYGVIMSRDRHNHFVRDRRDLQRSVDRLRNDILFCSVYRVNCTIRKLCRIFADIRSRRANGDIAEIRAFRRSGKAGNAMLLSIISHRVAVRLQLDVLIIV